MVAIGVGFKHQNNRIFATRLVVRNEHNQDMGEFFFGPSLTLAWSSVEQHVEAVEGARPEMEAAA